MGFENCKVGFGKKMSWELGLVPPFPLGPSIQKIVRVDETTHKIGNFFDAIHRSQSPISFFQIKKRSCRRGVHSKINKTCHIKIAHVDGAYPSK